jgi:hypothetical protein
MPTHLNTKAVEESSYVVTVSCKNATGGKVTPNSCKWKLLDEDGNHVNSRVLTTISAALSTAMKIVLSSNDLALPDSQKPRRKVVIIAKYTGNEGTSLPLTDEVTFDIVGVQGIT